MWNGPQLEEERCSLEGGQSASEVRYPDRASLQESQNVLDEKQSPQLQHRDYEVCLSQYHEYSYLGDSGKFLQKDGLQRKIR